jgi:hypothetical protein
MAALVRWVLTVFVALCLASLLFPRGGLGEYLRGGTLTTAHLERCVDDVWREQSNVTCTATWDGGVQGTVQVHDATGAQAIDEGQSGNPHPIRLPQPDMRVFADDRLAQQADSDLIAIGWGVLAVFVGLLGWTVVGMVRRRAGAGSMMVARSRRSPQPRP